MNKPGMVTSIVQSELTRRQVLGDLGKVAAGAFLASPLALLLEACGGSDTSTSGTKVSSVRVAGVFGLTGVSAVFGAGARDGAKQVFDAINASGGLKGLGGAKIDYVVYDAGDQATNATSLTQRAFDEGAVLAIGCGNGGLTLAASQAAAQLNKLFLTGDPTDTITTRGLTSVYQVGPVVGTYARQAIDQTIDMMQKNGTPLKKAAIVRLEIATFNALSPIMTAYLKSKGVEVADISYATTQTTFGPIISQVKNSGAQVMFQLSNPGDGVGVIRAAKVQGFQPTAIAGVIAAYTNPSFWSQLGPDAEGLYGAVQFSTSLPYSWLPAEVDKWNSAYGSDRQLDAFSAVYMAVGATVVDALNRAGSPTTDQITKALKSTNIDNKTRFVTLPGGVKFSDKGANTAAAGVIVQSQKGKVIPIAPTGSAVAKPVFPKPNWAS
jgi:branched-chain amino acid transport system substrate-binding protein